MSPTVLREGPFRLFFFSREEPRMHVHVSHPDGEAKFWLQPEIALAESVGLSARQITDAQDIVERHTGEIRDAWIRHFGA
jgi:ribosomal protein L16/L10AE